MGALDGFRYREIAKRLKHLGLVFHRQAAGSHEAQRNAGPAPLDVAALYPGSGYLLI
jgi:hypothetical protein